jgi:hypothetical protein
MRWIAMKRIAMWIAIALAISAVALVIVKAFLAVKSQVSYTFDFGSVLDAFALLVIGALIEYAYSKRSSDKRADTELLLGLVAEARAALAEVEKKAQVCENERALTPEEQFALTCAERELSNAVHSLEVGLRHCDVTPHALKFDSLKDARLELKDSLTDTPFPGPYDHGSRGRIRSASKTMRDELTRMAFAVNHR